VLNFATLVGLLKGENTLPPLKNMSANVLVEEEGRGGLSYTEGFRVLLTDHPYAEAISYAYGISTSHISLFTFHLSL